MSNFLSQFLGSGIEGAAKGLGSLAKDIRSAITGEEPVGEATRVALEKTAVELEAIGQQLPMAVNVTMQAESKSEQWPQYSWRPFWGFVSGLAFLIVVSFCCFLGYKAVIGGDTDALEMIPKLVTAFAALFTIAGAILGVTAWHRGLQKRNQ